VSILADTAARARDLDEAAAEAAKKAAEEAVLGHKDKMDVAEAQAELARAVAQLKAIGQLRKKR
jgi:F-type H+-transporting ATPase subunit epsilon